MRATAPIGESTIKELWLLGGAAGTAALPGFLASSHVIAGCTFGPDAMMISGSASIRINIEGHKPKDAIYWNPPKNVNILGNSFAFGSDGGRSDPRWRHNLADYSPIRVLDPQFPADVPDPFRHKMPD